MEHESIHIIREAVAQSRNLGIFSYWKGHFHVALFACRASF